MPRGPLPVGGCDYYRNRSPRLATLWPTSWIEIPLLGGVSKERLKYGRQFTGCNRHSPCSPSVDAIDDTDRDMMRRRDPCDASDATTASTFHVYNLETNRVWISLVFVPQSLPLPIAHHLSWETQSGSIPVKLITGEWCLPLAKRRGRV